LKNIYNEKPDSILYGRTLYTMNFVDSEDIKEKIVLDIGCGTGWFEFQLLKKDVKRIIALDIDLQNIKQKDIYFNSKVEFIQGDTMDIKINKNSIDTVCAWEVLEHLPLRKENEFFSDVLKILRPKGVFYLSTPYNHILSKLFDPAWYFLGHRHYGILDINKIVDYSKFELKKISIKGAWWDALSLYNLYISKWIFRRDLFLKHFFTSRLNDEYKSKKGFISLFLKFKKI